jgi:hypothetical protein
MLKLPLLAVAAALTFSMSSGRADEPKPEADKNEQGIKAEVRGTLHFEDGHGYFITVKPADTTEPEMRVWLWISEDKALVRKLQGLDGKEVVAKGKLAQRPPDRHTSVPPMGMYITRPEIRAAGSH